MFSYPPPPRQKQQKQQLQQPEKASNMAPSMAQGTTDFPVVPIFGIDSAQANHSNFHDNFAPIYGTVGLSSIDDFGGTRKRRREDEGIVTSTFINPNFVTGHHHRNHQQQQSLLADDVILTCKSPLLPSNPSVRMQKQLLELDHLILMQMEMVSEELEQMRKKYWVNVFRAVEDGVQRVLRAKDEEIAEVTRRNSVLEERVNILFIEGQMWKSAARTNESAVTALRQDIELAKQAAAAPRPQGGGDVAGEAEDSVSCCDLRRRSMAEDGGGCCRRCRTNEVSVLVLPCRHLCLCGECESTADTCPICGIHKRASIKVLTS